MLTKEEIFNKWSDGKWHFIFSWDMEESKLAHKLHDMKIAHVQPLPYGDYRIIIKEAFLKEFNLEDIVL